MGAGPKPITHPPDTAMLRVLAYKDDMVEFTMFRLSDGAEVGRTTVPRAALMAMLTGKEPSGVIARPKRGA